MPADRPQCPPPASMWLPDCTMLQDQKRRDAHGAISATMLQYYRPAGGSEPELIQYYSGLASSDQTLQTCMERCGLGAWHPHFVQHLGVTTVDQLTAVTAMDLRRMGIAANMKLVSSPSGSPAVPCQCMYLASGRSDEGCVAGCQNNRPSVGGDQEA